MKLRLARGLQYVLAVFAMHVSAMFAASSMELESAAYGVLASMAMASLWNGRVRPPGGGRRLESGWPGDRSGSTPTPSALAEHAK